MASREKISALFVADDRASDPIQGIGDALKDTAESAVFADIAGDALGKIASGPGLIIAETLFRLNLSTNDSGVPLCR